MISVVILCGLLTVTPTSFAHGNSMGTATTVTAGTYNDYLTTSGSYYIGWYKISCSKGETLEVTVTFTPAGYDWVYLYIYDPSQDEVLEDDGAGDIASGKIVCAEDGYYYIGVDENLTPTSPIYYSLVISKSSAIPGFELLYLFFSLLVLLGLSTLIHKSKLPNL